MDCQPPLPGSSEYTYTFMFSVCIYDDTACCDAIVYSTEGERLLGGVTAQQLYHNPSLQQSYQLKLMSAIAAGATFEFEIVTYLTAGQPSPDCVALFGGDVPGTNRDSDHGLNKREEEDVDRYYCKSCTFSLLIDFIVSCRPLVQRVQIVNSSFFQPSEELNEDN